jgi:hypothetical protein
MIPRKVETILARFTLAALVIYFPAETWFSWPYGLTCPFYLVDLIAMILMLWGALHSLRARPRCAPAILCGAYGWAACNGWRATFGRISELREGGSLDFGACELWCVGAATTLALICLLVSLILVVRHGRTVP